MKNVPAVYANIHAFNRWFDEEWGFGRDGKIFAPRDLPDVDCLVMGSEFPHAEGLAEPAEFAALLAGLTGQQQRQVLRDNAAQLFGTD